MITRRTLAVLGGLSAPVLLAPAALATDGGWDRDRDQNRQHDRDRGTHVRVASTADGGEGSLRQAIIDANDRRGVTTIELTRGATYTLTVAGAGEDAAATGDLDVTGRLRIDGNGSTIDAAQLDRVFDVRGRSSLTLADLVLTGGAPPATESGGAIRSVSALSLFRVRATGNVVTGAGASGGAIINDGGSLRVERSQLDHNTSVRAGGAVEANGGVSTFVRARLLANATGPGPGNGGAVHVTGAGKVTVTRSIVQRNSAAAEGGGLWNSADGRMHVYRSVVRANTASGAASDQGGGGIFNDGGTVSLDRSWVSANVADGMSGSGGGILNNGGNLIVVRTKLTRNTSQRAGGAVEAVAGSTTFFRARLSANATGPAPGNGGGFHMTGAGEVSVVRTVVRGNTAAAEGGGLWNSAAGTMTVERSVIVANTASGAAPDQGGGGLFNDGGTLEVERSSIGDNAADGLSGSGGGIFNNMGTLHVRNTEIDDNTSARAGGGIEANAGMTTLRDVDLVDNSTAANPGNGGGLHLTGAGRVDIRDGSVLVNSAAAEGGGLWNSATGTMVVVGTDISDNEAPVGPDVFNDGGTFTVNGDPVPVGP